MIDPRRRLRALREEQQQGAAGRSARGRGDDARAERPAPSHRPGEAVTAYDELWYEGRPTDA